LPGADADCVEARQQVQRGQLADRVRQGVDAHTYRPDIGGGFEDLTRHAFGMQHQRQRQAADAAAGDQDRH
jgi:hypothetical protein